MWGLRGDTLGVSWPHGPQVLKCEDPTALSTLGQLLKQTRTPEVRSSRCGLMVCPAALQQEPGTADSAAWENQYRLQALPCPWTQQKKDPCCLHRRGCANCTPWKSIDWWRQHSTSDNMSIGPLAVAHRALHVSERTPHLVKGFWSCQRWRQSGSRFHQGGLSWALTQELHMTGLQVVDATLDLNLTCSNLAAGRMSWRVVWIRRPCHY